MSVQERGHEAVTVRVFSQRLSSTRKGARLARLLALHQLDEWGIAYDTVPSDAAGAIVVELAANAVTHGRVAGRDFELRLALSEHTLRVERRGPGKTVWAECAMEAP